MLYLCLICHGAILIINSDVVRQAKIGRGIRAQCKLSRAANDGKLCGQLPHLSLKQTEVHSVRSLDICVCFADILLLNNG